MRHQVNDVNLYTEIQKVARGFQEAARKKGVAVGRAFPPMTTWARISIGTKEEMEKALPVFLEILSGPPTPQTSSPGSCARSAPSSAAPS